MTPPPRPDLRRVLHGGPRRLAVWALLLAVLIAGGVASAPGLLLADAVRPLPLSAFATERLTIATRSARLLGFTAWRADDPERRAQGLMFVRNMAGDQAMIFLYRPAQPVAMWMKNTYLSLDMLFVDAQGCIVTIAQRTTPLSLGTVTSGYPVELVVELVAGTVESLHITVGDRVLRPEAGWPAGGVLASRCTLPQAIR